ncbi:DUF1761 domain-containing protein [Labrenzia sp. PO1]|jgi:hypothetical protein|uniref:DUF1761 domain-containing protein n=1 Tax=Stappiaceae TaxID=2821832 RepID=UPI0003B8A3E3|nr:MULTISPECIES: DUF1761 domain-containing protein [Stappiaceae]MCR9283771.1 DUF1761 domain-containing protein [Paracoccaceae bacterium]ERP87392.1 hypothetical protein Q669_11545 [Labrenzia sp. C1B10]ERS07696.1 hypothetical protein Q675_20180 [Labrenzia sp. C1B70]MBO6855286.1 DUF1761 domain-containing protein [Roseibium sp.]MBO9461566.1 DUF1761 domain-containing protein [Labrenzia sp. R5_0]
MMFDGINLIAVAAAAIVSFLFGALWYGILGKAWMNAAGLTKEQTRPNPVVFATAFFCQIIMAFVFAGVIYHTGGTDIRNGIISALMIWVGIVMTTQIVNHRFQGLSWNLTLIDGGHWLGVLLVQGIVIGWLS